MHASVHEFRLSDDQISISAVVACCRLRQGYRESTFPGTTTQFPSGLAVAASWDVSVMEAWGSSMGAEFRAKGANVQLGPGLCLGTRYCGIGQKILSILPARPLGRHRRRLRRLCRRLFLGSGGYGSLRLGLRILN